LDELKMTQQADSFLRLAQIAYSRSSALISIQWTLVGPIAALIVLVLIHAPSWLLVVFAAIVAAVVLVIIGAFLYFMLRNVDALRSESYGLIKKALEERVFGDSLTGEIIAQIDENSGLSTLNVGPSTDIESKHG
jgi:hypothetical protein